MKKIHYAARNGSAEPAVRQLPKIANVTPTVRRLAAGEALFHKGDSAFGIFRLIIGQIWLVRVTPEGIEVPMHRPRPGELFAEASLFSARYHCDAVALAESEVLLYPKAEIVQQLKKNEEEMWAFAGEMAQRLQGLRTQLEIRQIRSAPQRVLQSLQLRSDADGHWTPDGTLKQFAEEIGLSHEALYRALATLKKEGCIKRDNGQIRLVTTKKTNHWEAHEE